MAVVLPAAAADGGVTRGRGAHRKPGDDGDGTSGVSGELSVRRTVGSARSTQSRHDWATAGWHNEGNL